MNIIILVSAENFDNEEIIYTSNPFAIEGSPRRNPLISALLLFILLFIGLPMFLIGFAFPVLLGQILSFIGFLIFLGGIGVFFMRRRPRRKNSIQYVLSNKRAMVIHADRDGKKIIQECNLADTVPIVQKKRSINLTENTSETGTRTATTGITVGDVVFMQKAAPKVIFKDVEDPDGIVRTVEQIKKSMLT
jgi:hypothetical protein